MIASSSTQLVLIRHAPALTGGRLCGRLDVPAQLPDAAALARVAAALADAAQIVSSPALRCRQTAEALFPGRLAAIDPQLWEQDFGVEDGLSLDQLPDLGPMPLSALADRCPRGGESFARMVARVIPSLTALARDAAPGSLVAVVAHAGTVRAGLALALGTAPAALAFEIAPLSLTRLRYTPDGWSIASVNHSL